MELKEAEEIEKYCMDKPCAYETRPFGNKSICYKVAGKIFAQFMTGEDRFIATLKTNPEAAGIYRSAYPGVVVRGYYCPPVQQPYWNTIDLTRFGKDKIIPMIDEAYDEVIKKLPGKERNRLPVMAGLRFEKTDGEDETFAKLCGLLDANLEEIVSGKFERKKYEQYNLRDSIHDVIVVYHEGKAVGCGAYKFYDEETVELKRIYIDHSCRGMGLGKELLRRLEADAKIAGYRYAVLETGELLKEATGLYRKMGYKVIPNYGQYADMPESLCMSKKL